MKEFRTAKKAKTKQDTIRFKVDGETMTAIRPKSWTTLETAAGADENNPAAAAKASIDMITGMFDAASRQRLLARLRDPDDALDLNDVQEYLTWLTEEWSGRPTGSSSA